MSKSLRRNFRTNLEARFHLELAESLGMTRGELLDRMSSKEMSEWLALWSLRADEREEMNRQAALKRK